MNKFIFYAAVVVLFGGVVYLMTYELKVVELQPVSIICPPDETMTVYSRPITYDIEGYTKYSTYDELLGNNNNDPNIARSILESLCFTKSKQRRFDPDALSALTFNIEHKCSEYCAGDSAIRQCGSLFTSDKQRVPGLWPFQASVGADGSCTIISLIRGFCQCLAPASTATGPSTSTGDTETLRDQITGWLKHLW